MQHKKSRRYAPCGTISCFIRFLFAILVPCVLLACSLRSKTNHFRGTLTTPKPSNFLQNSVQRHTEKQWKLSLGELRSATGGLQTVLVRENFNFCLQYRHFWAFPTGFNLPVNSRKQPVQDIAACRNAAFMTGISS